MNADDAGTGGAGPISNEYENTNRGNQDKAAIDDFLKAHRFTSQTRRELAEWLPEIAYRENASASDIINGENIQSILKSEKLNAPQKHQKIRDELYKKRFPEYSKLQEKWKKTAASANPAPAKIRFTPSPAFEKKHLEIKLTIQSAEEAKTLLNALSKIEPDVWDELLYPRVK
jgi:hypothetical protein